MNNDVENLIEAMTKVRPEMLNEEATKLFNTIMKILDERDILIQTVKELQEMKKEILTDDLGGKYNIYRDNKIKELEKERDYYKKMYLEFNEGIVAGMKVIEERDKQKR